MLPTNRKPETNMIVTQSNRLVEARYTLSLYEQRLVLMMIAMVEPADEDLKDYIIRISDFGELLGLKNKNIYSQIKNILLKLRERTLLIPKGEKDYLITGWISSAEYVSNDGVVKLSFDPKLKPYLPALKSNFTKQKLGEVIKFKGVYTIRIYGLLKQYKKIGRREFSLDDFRNTLGIKKHQYTLFSNLKSRIITQAQKEFNKQDKDGNFLSDINFDFEVKKIGRRVSHLIFIIKNQKTKSDKSLQAEVAEENPYQNSVEYKEMLLIAISENKAQAIIEQYGIETVAEKIQVLKERQEVENIKSPSGFFIKALKEDYKSEKLQRQKQEQERRAEEDKKRKLEYVEKLKHHLIIKFGREAKKDFLDSLSKSKEHQIIEELKEEYLENDDFFKIEELNKNGLSSLILGADITKRIPGYAKKKEIYIRVNLRHGSK